MEAWAVRKCDFDFADLRCRRATTCCVALDIPCEGSAAKAKALATHIKSMFRNTAELTSISTKPVQMAEIGIPAQGAVATIGRRMTSQTARIGGDTGFQWVGCVMAAETRQLPQGNSGSQKE